MREAKAQYKALFEKVRAIINKHDPFGFDPGSQEGAPVDEYDPETGPIVTFLVHRQEEIKVNNELLVDEINRVWKEMFGEPCPMAEEIATDILRECM